MHNFSVIEELAACINPMAWVKALADLPHLAFFDSAQTQSSLGRYSYITADPFLYWEYKEGILRENDVPLEGDVFSILRRYLQEFALPSIPGLPPFQGGMAGYLGYGLGRILEKLPDPKPSDPPSSCPDLALGCYDLVLAIDHQENRAWIFSSGFPEKEEEKRRARARYRLEEWKRRLLNTSFAPTKNLPPVELKAKQRPEHFQRKVARAIEYIQAGDIYQANISQEFGACLPENYDLLELYDLLRNQNPAPFAAYLRGGKTSLLCCSPERFLKMQKGRIETRPIKGTRPRHLDPVLDQEEARQLEASSKDRAENLMIVDLLRNDLSRVAELGTVKVPVLCGLESFAAVHHLVSVVQAQLKEDHDAIDLLRACFPGGSITGAPKIRAMEIIHELEEEERGPYCGAVLWLGFDGSMDSNIIIRSLVAQKGEISLRTGCGIVADSDPLGEYRESMDKAKAIIEILRDGK